MGVSTGIAIGKDPINYYDESASVLFVDDNPIIQKMAQKWLMKWHQPALCKDGKYAIEFMEQAWKRGQEIAVIFMDATMPIIDGVEATSKIFGMADLYKKKVVIVLQTSNTEKVGEDAFKDFMTSDYESGNKIFRSIGGKLTNSSQLAKVADLAAQVKTAWENNLKLNASRNSDHADDEDHITSNMGNITISNLDDEKQISVDTNTNHE